MQLQSICKVHQGLHKKRKKFFCFLYEEERDYGGRKRRFPLFVHLVNTFIIVYNVRIQVVAQCVFLRAG